MGKRTYVFKYAAKFNKTSDIGIFTHKIRAITEKEAYYRFQRWDNHRPDRDEFSIFRVWLDPEQNTV